MICSPHYAQLIENLQPVEKRVFKRPRQFVIENQEDAVKDQYLNLSVWLVFEHKYNYGEEKPSEHIKYIIEEGKL